MSETKREVIMAASDETYVVGQNGNAYRVEPAEPVIEVAPGEPTCEYCGPVCYRGAEHNARVEDGARYTDDPVPAVPETWDALSRQCTLAAKDGQIPDELYDRALAARERENRPAVHAQEAPREQKVPKCSICYDVFSPCICAPYEVNDPAAQAYERCLARTREGLECAYRPHDSRNHCWFDPDNNPPSDLPWEPVDLDAEPQAGAQVPSRDEIRECLKLVEHKLDQFIRGEYNWRPYPSITRTLEEVRRVLALPAASSALERIGSYAREAAKTPITREDMHDPLKAQTFYDEAKGFERLVLSEIGGSK